MYIFSYYVSKPVYQSVGTLYISDVNKTTQQRQTDEIILNEIVTSLGVDNDRVGDALGCYCIVDEESLLKAE